MVTSKYFKLQELVPESVYAEFGKKAWMVFDQRLLITLDELRSTFGALTCNNWHLGGTRTQCGFRMGAVGAPLSQHRFGRAADLVSANFSAKEMRDSIRMLRAQGKFNLITRIENNVNWLHIDFANTGSDNIVYFNP